MTKYRFAFAAVLSTLSALDCSSAFATCGQNGGPGYRNSAGKCVGWEALARQCGNPPTTKCSAELVADGAPDAAGKEESVRALMQSAHEKTNPAASRSH
jgi:hypothetical protein